ncbi:MAG: FG-GAP-like repeat-containing protein, partial [Bacteroidota bacterium]
MKSVLKVGTKRFSEIKTYIPSTQLPNYIFRNNHDLTFAKRTQEWGLDALQNTNGASYADLDGDGDLDLVLSNLDEPVRLYRNQLQEQKSNGGNYLKIRLNGPAKNTHGLGAKVDLDLRGTRQYDELSTTRGFQSSVAPLFHFGLGEQTSVQRLHIQWPDGKTQTLNEVAANQTLVVNYQDAKGKVESQADKQTIFVAASDLIASLPLHREQMFDDYEKQLLLPHKLSQGGPCLAVGDINGDGLEDFYRGGAAGQAGLLVIQQSDQQFVSEEHSVFNEDRACEDMGALFFDADGDDDLDLYVVSGSYEFEDQQVELKDRLYLNDGAGRWSKATDHLPDLRTNTGAIAAADVDGDGDLDLFIGGKSQPGKYPLAAPSYLLLNESGKFQSAGADLAPGLTQLGMVNAAVWTDFDNDRDPDLLVVGEWMPIKVLVNESGRLIDRTQELGLSDTRGWWNSITGGDFDEDGDMDYVLGNLGLNSKNQATPKAPFRIYTDDFDNNGSYDVALAYYSQGQCYPVRGRQCSSEQVPMIAERMVDYRSFGEATIDKVYGATALQNATQLEAHTFASSILENLGEGQFRLTNLPLMAQLAPTYGVLTEDWNRDGCLDLLLVGNQYPVEVETGRYDAHRG